MTYIEADGERSPEELMGIDPFKVICPHCNVDIQEHEDIPCLNWWVYEVVFCDKPLTAIDLVVLKQVSIPEYSSSISAAMEVLEKFEKMNWNIFIKRDKYVPGTGWRIMFFSRGGSNSDGSAFAESIKSLPLAICRAAVIAIKTNKALERETNGY